MIIWQNGVGTMECANGDKVEHYASGKHIDIKYNHFLDQVDWRDVLIRAVRTEKMKADIDTKVMGPKGF